MPSAADESVYGTDDTEDDVGDLGSDANRNMPPTNRPSASTAPVMTSSTVPTANVGGGLPTITDWMADDDDVEPDDNTSFFDLFFPKSPSSDGGWSGCVGGRILLLYAAFAAIPVML